MTMETIDKKEIKDFLERLISEKRELMQKSRYMSEHKFHKEEEYLRTKITVIEAIQFESELVVDSKRKGIDAKFMF